MERIDRFHITSLKFDELTLMQLYDIMRLRQEVFIVEQDCPYLDADGKDPFSNHLLVTNEEGILVAYCRLIPEGISYENFVSIGRVINSKEVRGKGIGKMLMQNAINTCVDLFGKKPIRIGAQAYLKSFYEDLGFIDDNTPYLEDGIPHLIMTKW